MDLTDFNCRYLNNLLDKVSEEQKSVFLLDDFNVNLLNYNDHNLTNKFFDSLASKSFLIHNAANYNNLPLKNTIPQDIYKYNFS